MHWHNAHISAKSYQIPSRAHGSREARDVRLICSLTTPDPENKSGIHEAWIPSNFTQEFINEKKELVNNSWNNQDEMVSRIREISLCQLFWRWRDPQSATLRTTSDILRCRIRNHMTSRSRHVDIAHWPLKCLFTQRIFRCEWYIASSE